MSRRTFHRTFAYATEAVKVQLMADGFAQNQTVSRLFTTKCSVFRSGLDLSPLTANRLKRLQK